MSAALRVEALKLTRSPVGVVATLAIVVGILALLAGITVGIAGGNPELIAKAGPAATLTWQGLLAGAAQITAAASILGFGIVLAWMFGREFVDGTITGLFALPIARSRIALAKLTVYALWAASVSIALTLGLLALGLLIGYGPRAPTRGLRSDGSAHWRCSRHRSPFPSRGSRHSPARSSQPPAAPSGSSWPQRSELLPEPADGCRSPPLPSGP